MQTMLLGYCGQMSRPDNSLIVIVTLGVLRLWIDSEKKATLGYPHDNAIFLAVTSELDRGITRTNACSSWHDAQG